MNDFIDTHAHVLPEIDDGAESDTESLKMLEAAVKSQIRCVFATPHLIPKGIYHPTKKRLNERFRHLEALRDQAKLDIELRLGCELRLNAETLDVILKNDYLTYQGTDYVLVEMNLSTLNHSYIDTCLSELVSQGKKILIAHPERYFQDTDSALKQVKAWKKAGYFMQVNRTSLVTPLTPMEHKIAMTLLKEDLIDIIASDGHKALGQRLLKLDDSFSYVSKHTSEKVAIRLHQTNPYLLYSNQELEQPVSRKHPLKHLLERLLEK